MKTILKAGTVLSAIGMVGILVWDIAAQLICGIECTLSHYIWGLSWNPSWSFVSFLLGFVCGHLVWAGEGAFSSAKKK